MRDKLIHRLCNLLLRFASKKYRQEFAMIVEFGHREYFRQVMELAMEEVSGE